VSSVVAAVPWSPLWQGLLNGMGWLLSKIYEVVPNWGISIILLTVAIRLILLPLGIKQIRSMQHMQAIQPKIKALQTKYKGNRQKQQEEVMKLYQEYGVSPFSGCWPVLLQFPILIAMYSVVRFPQHPIHIPTDSSLYRVIQRQIPERTPDGALITTQKQVDEALAKGTSSAGTDFLYMNLLCSAVQAGNANATLGDRVSVGGKTTTLAYPVDCGRGVATRIPYYLFAALMFATTWYQQRQMQRASPPGAASQQQQAMLKVMPIMFGVFGIFFPVGLVLYWTASNLWQIGQQHFMLKTRPTAETLAARADGEKKPANKGFFARMMERAEQERQRREGTVRKPPPRRPGPPRSAGGRPGSQPPKKPGSGGSGGPGDRKKRPKR